MTHPFNKIYWRPDEPLQDLLSHYGRMPGINVMSEPIVITAADSIIRTLNFKSYRSKVERRFVRFMPKPNDPQTIEVRIERGTGGYMGKKGDFLISELDRPDDFWAIDPGLFEQTYVIVRPGYCVKKATTLLVPLTDLTVDDPDQKVILVTLEGFAIVRAGDFWLAKGIGGEIWPYPRDKIDNVLMPEEMPSK